LPDPKGIGGAPSRKINLRNQTSIEIMDTKKNRFDQEKAEIKKRRINTAALSKQAPRFKKRADLPETTGHTLPPKLSSRGEKKEVCWGGKRREGKKKKLEFNQIRGRRVDLHRGRGKKSSACGTRTDGQRAQALLSWGRGRHAWN